VSWHYPERNAASIASAPALHGMGDLAPDGFSSKLNCHRRDAAPQPQRKNKPLNPVSK
jgi:hypothetical protein